MRVPKFYKQTLPDLHNFIATLARVNSKKRAQLYSSLHNSISKIQFEPLGRVFGISGKQVEELATEVVRSDWQVTYDGSYAEDPRVRLWDSSRNDRETWHDHGSYPRVDRYSFYLSYHSMLVVAAKLLQKMPVVRRRDWNEDEDQWLEWLHGHLLTRNDGLWLADRRDPAPLLQPKWIHETKTENWRSEITPDDFLDVTLFECLGKAWLNVSGYWEEGYTEREEEVHISTALVSPPTSQSLLYAMTDSPDPYDFNLPDYREKEWEFESDPFELKGWIQRDGTEKGLDEYDPYAGEIAFPPYQVGQSVVESLSLSVDTERREWFLPNADEASLVCELWSTNRPRPDEDPLRQGNRISASLEFLKTLCLDQRCKIIFKVQISRRFHRSSYSRNEHGNEYKPPYTKIYLLSADGKLRDTETNCQVG